LGRAGLSALGNKDVYNKENPFLTQQELQKFDTGKGTGLANYVGNEGVTQQLKDSASIGSWAVPFGKGSGIVSKALLPGAAVGSLQGYSKKDATGQTIIKDAILGAATAGVLQGGGDLLGKLFKKTGNVTQKLGTDVRESVRQIKRPASIYGSAEEKAINKTLTDLKITGSPSKQYSLLQPKMAQLENKLKTLVENNPGITVAKADIKSSFLDNLKSALRSKDLTNKQATTEIDGYLADLIKSSGGKGKFTDIDLDKLRELKKLVNQDYSQVNNIVQRGGVLNPRQKVIEAAWNSLDSAVKTASPEMKKLLSQESNLFKAAQSLSNARTNPSTQRLFGTSIPGEVTSTGKDWLGRFLGWSGKGTETLGGKIDSISPMMSKLGSQGSVGVPSSLQISPNEVNQVDNTMQNYGGQNDAQSNVNHSGIVAQNYLTGKSPEQHYAAYQNAILAGDKGAASQIRQQYEDEVAYQKTGSNKSLSAAASQVVGKATAAKAAISVVRNNIEKNPLILAQAAIPGTPGARVYEAAVSSITDAIGGLRTGASVSPQQQLFYRNLLPKLGDSKETIKYKLDAIETELNTYLQGVENIQDPQIQ
jgi:hypothetical protein